MRVRSCFFSLFFVNQVKQVEIFESEVLVFFSDLAQFPVDQVDGIKHHAVQGDPFCAQGVGVVQLADQRKFYLFPFLDGRGQLLNKIGADFVQLDAAFGS